MSEISTPIDGKSLLFELPPYLEFRKTEARGRGIYAKAPIAAGTAVLSIRPTIYTLLTKEIARHCTNCTYHPVETGTKNDLKKCTGCKVVRYCGAKCQSVDWPNHKPECAALQRWSVLNEKEGGKLGIAPNETVRGMARLIWKRKKMGVDSEWSKQIHGMKSHPVLEKDYIRMGAIWGDLKKYMPLKGVEDLPGFFIPDEDVLIELITQFTGNNFVLHDQSLFEIGLCCSPLVALHNHNCDHNVTTQFFTAPAAEPEKTGPATTKSVGLILDMVAFRDINAGEELTMSYTRPSRPTAERRKALERNYGFICKCPLCEPQMHGRTEMDWRETLVCPKNCGGACPIPNSEAEYPAKCAKCGAHSNIDPTTLSEKRKLGEEALKTANKLDLSDDLEEGMAIARSAIALLEPMITPCTEPLFGLCSLQRSMLFQTSSLDYGNPIPPDLYNELAHMATLDAFAVQKLFRPGHPDRAKVLSQAGCIWAMCMDTFNPSAPHEFNIDLQLQRLEKAKATLQQALQELQWGWGKKRDAGALSLFARMWLGRVESQLKECEKRNKAKVAAKFRGTNA